MGKLSDVQILAWIKAGERFEGRADGDGLSLRGRPSVPTPEWRFRYQFDRKPRVMSLGTYGVSVRRNGWNCRPWPASRPNCRDVRRPGWTSWWIVPPNAA